MQMHGGHQQHHRGKMMASSSSQVVHKGVVGHHWSSRPCRRPLTCLQAVGAAREHVLDVWAVSDLHADHAQNMQWLQSHMSSRAYGHNSVLLVAGDVSDNMSILREVLTMLKAAFWQVVFVPGNHELWVKGRTSCEGEPGAATDSLEKLEHIRALCDELGVHMGPVRLGRLVVAPILAWHHQSWDTEPDIPDNLVPRAGTLTISDYARCVWPEELNRPLGNIHVATHVDNANPPVLTLLESRPGASTHRQDHAARSTHTGAGEQDGTLDSHQESEDDRELQLITLSHFLPSQQLLPEKRFLTYPNLAKAVGSVPLYDRVRRLRPAVHVFGHTHFAWDAVLSCCGVRCIQAPLCYPAERQKRMRSITMQPHSPEWQPFHPGPQHGVEWLPLLLGRASYTLVRSGPPDDNSRGTLQSGGSAGFPSAQHSNLEETQADLLGSQRGDEIMSVLEQQLPCLIQQRSEAELRQGSQGGQAAVDTGNQWVQVRNWKLELCPELNAMWSNHYKVHARRPEDTELAPWVAPRYQRMRARRQTAVVED